MTIMVKPLYLGINKCICNSNECVSHDWLYRWYMFH